MSKSDDAELAASRRGGSGVTLDPNSEADAADLARALWAIAGRPNTEEGWYELAPGVLRRLAALRAGDTEVDR